MAFPWAAAAIGGSSLLGGLLGSRGAEEAGEEIADAMDDANKLIEKEQRYNKAQVAPWYETGKNQLAELWGGEFIPKPSKWVAVQDLKDSDGYYRKLAKSDKKKHKKEFQAAVNELYNSRLSEWEENKLKEGIINTGPGEFEASPSYNFVKDEAMQGLQRGASAQGMGRSGALMKASGERAGDLASQEYDNFLNRWITTQVNPRMLAANQGQLTATNLGNQGLNAANQMSQNTMQGGYGQAAGTMGAANSWTNNLQWGAGNLLDYYNYNKQSNALG